MNQYPVIQVDKHGTLLELVDHTLSIPPVKRTMADFEHQTNLSCSPIDALRVFYYYKKVYQQYKYPFQNSLFQLNHLHASCLDIASILVEEVYHLMNQETEWTILPHDRAYRFDSLHKNYLAIVPKKRVERLPRSCEISIYTDPLHKETVSLVSKSHKQIIVECPVSLFYHQNINLFRVEYKETIDKTQYNQFLHYLLNLLFSSHDTSKRSSFQNQVIRFLLDIPEHALTLCTGDTSSILLQTHWNDNFECSQEQKEAFQMVLTKPISAIQGSPGTGKTRLIAHLAKHLVQTNETMLILTETNASARHVCREVSKQLSRFKLSLFVSSEYFSECIDEKYSTLDNNGYVSKTMEEYVSNQTRPVVICTAGFLEQHAEKLTQLLHRSWLIMDECSQMTLRRAIMVLSFIPLVSHISCFGDVRQLPPYDSRLTNNSKSFMEHLWKKLPLSCKRELNEQWRMPFYLSEMISSVFYEAKMISMNQDRSTDCIDWIHVVGQEQRVKSSYCNKEETNAIQAIYRQLLEHGYQSHQVAILTFYEAQRYDIDQSFRSISMASTTNPPNVFNIDSYQGQECDVIILCLTRQKLNSFVSNPQRANVACSRAKYLLYIVGNRQAAEAESSSNCWKRISEFIRKIKKKRSLQ